MKDILLLGAGKIGEMISELLGACGDYRVTVADMSEDRLTNSFVRTTTALTMINAGIKDSWV